MREGLRRGREARQGAGLRQRADRVGAVSEGVGAARARVQRRGLHAGDKGPQAVAGRKLQRGDAREAQRGGEREEGG